MASYENLPDMVDVNTKQSIPIGGKVKLEEGTKILLKKVKVGDLLSFKWQVYKIC